MPRSGDTFRHLILQAAERYALAPELVASVTRVESNFEPRAVSPKGARGLTQLMPGTAKLMGVQDAFDVGQNIDGGVRHLRGLLDRYNGNIALALAAYKRRCGGRVEARWHSAVRGNASICRAHHAAGGTRGRARE